MCYYWTRISEDTLVSKATKASSAEEALNHSNLVTGVCCHLINVSLCAMYLTATSVIKDKLY